MSSQSVLVKSIDSIQEKSENILLKNANYYVLKKRFALIKKISRSRVKHANKILSFICTENCELKTFVNRVILEGEELKTTCISLKMAKRMSKCNGCNKCNECLNF